MKYTFALVIIVVASSAIAQNNRDPQTFERPRSPSEISGGIGPACPPGVRGPLAQDANVGGAGPTDWLISSSHWDDGKGNDFTTEQWCINAAPPFYSMRMKQSKNGAETLVAAPGTSAGVTGLGPC